MTEPPRLFVSEIFSAIQGEGRYVGSRQIFLRLAGCDLRCAYCDEPDSLEKKPGPARIEMRPGSREFEVLESPLPVGELASLISDIESRLAHRFLSVTGGEPLIQPAGLGRLLPVCRAAGMKIALETSGTRPDALRRVAEPDDVISMDIKLNSVDSTGVDPASQYDFLRAAIDIGAEVYCKAVVSAQVDIDELRSAAAWIADIEPSITLYLQPVSEVAGEIAPSAYELLGLQAEVMGILADTRVLPQVHKLMGQK